MSGTTILGIVREIIAIALLWAIGIMVWYAVGGEEWRQFSSWIAEPYAAYWQKWGVPFFVRGEGQAWVYAMALGLCALALLRFVPLSIWLAKASAGFALAYVTLYAFR